MILLPYAHEKQTVQRLPWVTFSLIAINVIVFLFIHYGRPDESSQSEAVLRFQEYYYAHPYLEISPDLKKYFSKTELDQLQLLKEGTDLSQISRETISLEQAELDALSRSLLSALNEDPYRKYGYVPGNGKWTTLITCQFIHSGWLHLIGNMLFLYLAGCSIEDLWGRPLYIVFYLISGVVATLMHELKFPDSMAPLVGASGAIAGLMGAFLFRLYNTHIHFFYFFFVLRFKWGTFRAPAFIMLPLWLAQQIFYASFSDGEAGVAFWAHIGGFLFGFGIAYLVKISKLEEKYIRPAIEKKVSIVQNPQFLRAIEFSERGDFPNALILLEKVVRQDPFHLDAYMEMRRIAEIQKDGELYSKYTAAILDILLRSRDWDLFEDIYRQYQSFPERKPLPAKTLFGVANHLEEIQDYSGALQHYEELCECYPEEWLAIKAWNKIYKICFERLSLREKGIQAFANCSQHPLADDQWRAMLNADAKRYSIQLAPAVTAPPSVRSIAAQAVNDPSTVPDQLFEPDNTGKEMFVPAIFVKLTLQGMILQNLDGTTELLPWKKMRSLSVGKIRNPNPSRLLVDFISSGDRGAIIRRVQADTISFDKVFPGVEQTFADAFHNFIGILLNNSGARCIPDRESCCGPNFATYFDEERYNARVKQELN